MMTADRVYPILYLAIAKAGNWANLCDYCLRAAISNPNFPPIAHNTDTDRATIVNRDENG